MKSFFCIGAILMAAGANLATAVSVNNANVMAESYGSDANELAQI